MKTKVLSDVFLGVLCCAVMADQKTKVSIRPTNESLPTMLSWSYWTAREYEPGGYQEFLDMVSVHSPYTLLMCAPRSWMRRSPMNAYMTRSKRQRPMGAGLAYYLRQPSIQGVPGVPSATFIVGLPRIRLRFGNHGFLRITTIIG